MSHHDLFSGALDGPGINIEKLDTPVQICISTKNSQYDIRLLDPDGWAEIRGGQYMAEPTRARLNGCTWGGTAIRQGWISPGMHLEIFIPSLDSSITTTRVKNARIIGEGWEYDLQWDKRSDQA